MLGKLTKELNKAANPRKAKLLGRYFKTGPGEYGAGDVFLGIMVPEQRKIAKNYINISLKDIQRLLNSRYHEYRLVALIILVEKYKKADKINKKDIVDLYLKNVRLSRVNNWDLVDLSAPKILGEYLIDKKKDVLYTLVKSRNLWVRRVAVLSTFAFIKNQKFSDALNISRILISDREDLIHKAVGWALREIGKRNLETEKKFLNKFAPVMPRVMLRYAAEKLKKADRQKYLSSKFKK